jgi:Putative metallopeptidase
MNPVKKARCHQVRDRPPRAGNAATGERLIYALPVILLLGAGPIAAQPALSGLPSFQARIDAVARALQDNPRLKNLSEQQRIDRVEFVVGNTLFVLLHELGHVHISEMKLPVLGREEDAADTFAALTMIKIGTSFSQRVLVEASKGWFLNDRRDQQTGAKPLYYDEHNLSQQRAYQVVCLMVGSDPVKFKDLADETKMPASRQETCKEDYVKATRSWDMVLRPYRRAPDQPETKINVVYQDANGDLGVFAQSFRAARTLEAVAQRSAADYEWPAPFTLEMRSCGGPNAGWDDKTRNLKICYELAFDFAELYRAYVPPTPVALPISKATSAGKKHKSK